MADLNSPIGGSQVLEIENEEENFLNQDIKDKILSGCGTVPVKAFAPRPLLGPRKRHPKFPAEKLSTTSMIRPHAKSALGMEEAMSPQDRSAFLTLDDRQYTQENIMVKTRKRNNSSIKPSA